MCPCSDGDSPLLQCQEYLVNDKLLLKWYGQNLLYTNATKYATKLVPFPLGLSAVHQQDRYLAKYLELRNFTNPFKGREQKNLWLEWGHGLEQREKEGSLDAKAEVREAVFVKFGFPGKRNAKKISSQKQRVRQQIMNNLCGGLNSSTNAITIRKDDVSCQSKKAKPSDLYAGASTYLFGLSPRGVGWDCYRTYELLLLGVVPIVQSRPGGTHGLFADLPVIEVTADLGSMSASQLLALTRGYVTSPAFRNNDFEKGWERLFLRYWRRRMLSEAGRDIVTDENTGKEYYRAWQYGPRQDRVLCGVGDCQ